MIIIKVKLIQTLTPSLPTPHTQPFHFIPTHLLLGNQSSFWFILLVFLFTQMIKYLFYFPSILRQKKLHAIGSMLHFAFFA